MEPYYASPDPHLPFPFNLVSRIWHRIWDGIALPCQKTSTLPPPSLGSSAKFTRFPLAPSPTSTFTPTPSSSPSCRPVHYNGISSLLDVDYLRGGASWKGSSQNLNWGSLRVRNPDINNGCSSTEFTDDPVKSTLKHNSPAPQLPEFPFAKSPSTPWADSIGFGLGDQRSPLGSKSQTSINVDDNQSSTETTSLESFLRRRLRERALSTRNSPLPRNGLTRALDLFKSPSVPGPSDTEIPTIDEQGELTDTDPTPSPPRPRLPSFGSSLGSSFGLSQFCSQWLASSSPQEEQAVGPLDSQSEIATAGSRSGQKIRSRSSECRSSASHRRSSSTSPSLSFMSEVFHRRRPGIFVSLGSMSSLALTLATGTVAQQRRLANKRH